MATAYVTIGQVEAPGVFHGGAAKSATVTTSGTSASTAITAGNEDYAQVYCDTGVYARSETVVSAATGIFCPPGVVTYIKCTPGKPISLIDA
jgi:hypothetical protein